MPQVSKLQKMSAVQARRKDSARFNTPGLAPWPVALLFVAVVFAAQCCCVHTQDACSAGQNLRTATLAGAMPLNGTGVASGLRDGAQALFSRPSGVAFSFDGGAVAVADADNNCIRLVRLLSGNASTLAGLGPSGQGSADGQAVSFNGPIGVDFSPSGALLAVADEQNNCIRLLADPLSKQPAASRTLTGGTAGTSDGTGAAAQFNQPADVAFSPDGERLVVAEKGANRIRMVVVASGETTTLAGNSSASGLADGAASQARFNLPNGIAFSPDGTSVAVADSGNNAVRLISFPASASGNVTVKTLAGGSSAGFDDGLSASFSDPRGLSFSPDGSLLAVADHGNHAIRIINITSLSTRTVAGRAPFSTQLVADKLGDGAAPTFFQPTSVSFSPDGKKLAVADSGNHAIRLIDLVCKDCDVGSYKSSVGSADCALCPSNSTSRAGSNSSTQCICRAGYVMEGGTCVMCQPGTFTSGGGATKCLQCTAGTYSTSFAAAFASVCTTCPQNAFSNVGSASATDCFCKVGFTGSSGQNCSACANGFYKATNGSAACTACEAGKFSSGESSNSCAHCRAGTSSNSLNASSCSVCEAGQYSGTVGLLNCTACEVGKFSNGTGVSACENCVAGFYSNTLSALACVKCEAGTYSAANASLNCTACEIGKASNISGVNACTNCAPGSYSNTLNAVACSLCEAGEYSGDSASNCLKCPAGTFSEVGSGNCTCNMGYSGSNMGPCLACGAGRYKAMKGSTPCLFCERGKFGGTNASSTCSLCPAFATSPSGSLDVADCECDVGYTNAKMIVSSQASNSTSNNTSAATSNASNSVNTTSQPSEFKCRMCPTGTFKSVTGNASCTQCPANTYSGNGLETCSNCPPFSSAPAGSTIMTDCKCNLGYLGPDGGTCYLPQCTSGQYNKDFGGLDPVVLTCTSCPDNSWSMPGRLGIESCICIAGFSSNDGGPCQSCKLGTYKSYMGSAPCSVCSENFFTESESAAVSCIECPNNSYSFAGSSGAGSCSCNEGYSGPRCIIYFPQNIFKRGSCAAGNEHRKFQVDMSMSMEASSVEELQKTKAQSVKEIANYFGVNSSLPVFDDGPSERRATYDLNLKKEVEGDQQQFKDSAASLASALTSFLQLRGLNSVRVSGISVACGVGFTPKIPGTDSPCVPCSIGTYKRVLDNSPCVSCPEPTTTNVEGSSNVSACTEWAGQRLSRKTAEKAGYVISSVVGSVVGINTLGAVVGILTSLVNSAAIGSAASTSLYTSRGTESSSTVNGFTTPVGIVNGWGGGGSTMALIAQVQFLQVMARIGGSEGSIGMAHFANSIGWFNFEFEKVSFWGRSRNVHALTYSPLVDQGRQDASSAESCSFDRFAPSLDRLIMCVIILAGVAVIRLGLVCVLTCGLKKEVPACMQFGSWEGPVMLVEYIAICSSSLLAASTLCSKWMAFGYVLLVFWPVGFLVVSAAVTGLRVQKEQIVYESYDAEAAPPKLPPRFTEVWKSLDGTKGIIPNTLIMREWFLAIEVRGWWKDVRISTSGFRFLVGDYVGHAYFFGSWVLVKKILLLSATTAINGRGSAIMCIIVQTFDMFFVVGLRPYVSKITCVSECIAAVTNWLAFLNLGLLLWPDSIPLQLGETTVFVLAILGTAIATLAAIVEALMAAFMVLFGVCASLAACMGISGSCMVTARAKLQQCCFGSLPKASVEGEDGPIFLTSIACDWAESQQQASDVSQNMAWAPIPFPYDPNYPNVSPQDPAVLAAYYRQLADYHQMISYNMKANSTGRATSNPAGMISPVSMSTAPTPFYNADTIQKQAAPATEVRVFDPMGMRASAYSQSAEPLLPLVSASLYRPGGNPQPEQVWHSSMPRMSASPDQNYDTNMFSRRAGDDGGDGAHMSSMPPALQSLTQRLASISPLSSPRSPRSESYWRPKEEAPRSVNSFGLGEHSISPSKSPPTRNLPQLSPKNDRRGNQNGYSTATARFPQSPRRQLPDHDSPRNLQNSNTKRADELGDGITRRAEVLRNALSPSSPLASLSPSLASNAPVYASGMMGGPVAQLSPSRNRLDSNDAYYPPKGSPMRGVVVPSSIRSSPMGVGSPMSQAYTPAAITSDNPESLRQDLMSRLENDTSTLRQRFLATSPHVVPPAPSYPAPPPPGQAPQYGPDADSEWDTGFG